MGQQQIISRSVSLVFLIVITILTPSIVTQSPDYSYAPNITIPLDQPVDIRLKELNAKFSSSYKEDLRKQIAPAKERVGRFHYYIGRILMTFYMNVKGDPTMYDEMQEIADASGLDFIEIVLFNYFYEASCSSIIGRAADGTTLLFGSNLDFDFAPFIRKYTYQGIFTKDNQTIFTGNGLYGIIGVFRGQRVNNGDNFAVALNERDVERGNYLVNMFFGYSTNIAYFVRKTLLLGTYEEALDHILNEPLTTAAYFTIGGTYSKGGCVVERSASAVHSKTCLDQDNWFLVITNYDRDLPDPDDDKRRTPTEQKIKANGQSNFTAEFLTEVLSTAPLKRLPTDPYLTITTTVCKNYESSRSQSTWSMFLWNDLK